MAHPRVTKSASKKLQRIMLASGGVAGVLLVGAISFLWRGGQEKPKTGKTEGPAAVAAVANYVRSAACVSCHERQAIEWRRSHHALAMQVADEKTVLGNFAGPKFSYAGITSTFFKRDGKFFVRTDGADGKLADYEIKYTFGVTPLQQYLVELPGGRLQALSIAWDARDREQGGQRWLHLYPDEHITHDDELHWTRRAQNWNFMCAECHSTNLQKNYDPARREYKTTWSEINVSCEACHGPGSKHVTWAERKEGWASIDERTKGLQALFHERKSVQWILDQQSGNARRSAPRATETEIQLCARCHSRRAQLFDDYDHGQPLMNTHLPSLLLDGLYHSDGQINDEVYEYGSFVQSKMYNAGVTCSDCHEPHSGKLRAEGNALCATCHAASKYDASTHHRHQTGSLGAACVSCHMPSKTYMVIDDRRDHSFRIPRPDLSARIGTPNACTGCHKDRPASWAAGQIQDWFDSEAKGYQRYAETLHAARKGAAEAESGLMKLARDLSQPAIARATAVAELGRSLSQESLNAVVNALNDHDPMVRAAALNALEGLPLQQRWQAAHKLLSDPVRAVRVRAAGVLAGVPTERLSPTERTALQRASDEFLAAQQHNADDPAAQINLGNFFASRGDSQKAESAYREALAVDHHWVPAYVNLADLLRHLNRDAEGEELLLKGRGRAPKAAALHHSLGLLQVRQKNLTSALASLKRAAELAPRETRYSYVYAVALHDSGRVREAMAQVDAALARVPGDRSLAELREQLARTGTTPPR